METYSGIVLSEGTFEGEAFFYCAKAAAIESEVFSNDNNAEIGRFTKSLETVKEEYRINESALEIAGKDKGAALFSAYCVLASDPDFKGEVIKIITEKGLTAKEALSEYKKRLSDSLECSGNEFISRSFSDLISIIDSVSGKLTKTSEPFWEVTDSTVLLTQDISASDVYMLKKRNVGAIVVIKGNKNSHAAILARELAIPMIAVPELSGCSIKDKERVLVDCNSGLVIFNPEMKTLNSDVSFSKESASVSGKDFNIMTKSGKRLRVFANISGSFDVNRCLQNDADGIGLFRTEYLYLGRECAPTVIEQMEEYSLICSKMQNKPVIIRTADLSYDKAPRYMKSGSDINPALGLRGIRYSFESEVLFSQQLSALLQCAAVYDNLQIMFPMISSVEEMEKIDDIIQKLKKKLAFENKAFRVPSMGIMIETPAGVMMSRELAKKADFFCIGSNDLTQYTLAASRDNPDMAEFFDSKNPAVLRMIEITVKSAGLSGIPVGLCGELAGDTKMSARLLDMGIDSFSVAPSGILGLKNALKESGINSRDNFC